MLDKQVEEFAGRIGVARACQAFGVNPRSYRHRRQVRAGQLPHGRRTPPKARPQHPAALTSEERWQVLEVLCCERFYDLAPAQVFHTLLNEGVYLCSIRQMDGCASALR